MTVNPLVAPENARSEGQAAHMIKNAAAGKCVFCDIDWSVNREFLRGDYWRLMPNAFPYPNHSYHLIITPIRHVTDISDLTEGEQLEWWKLNCWAIKEFKLPGGGIVMRFGDFKYQAGTIAHLHSHIQVPDGTSFSIATFFRDEKLTEFFNSLKTKK